jgi:predicted nucleic acid-binding Zn ribbon protein
MDADGEADSVWDEDWPDDADGHGTVPCPHCGAEIYEDAPQCPACGDYVTPGGHRLWGGKPIWYIVIALLGVVAVILTCLF